MNIQLDLPMALALMGVALILYSILGGRIRKIAVIELDNAPQDLDRRQRSLILLFGATLLIGGIAWKAFTSTSGQVAQATPTMAPPVQETSTPAPTPQATPSPTPEPIWEAIPFASSDRQLGSGWTWHRGESGDSDYGVSQPHSITIVAGPYTDHWEVMDTSARLEYALSGDFEVQVEVDFQPVQVHAQHAGLSVISSSDPYTWIRISRCFDMFVQGGDGLYVGGDQAGQAIRLVSRSYIQSTVHLKIERKGSQFSLYYGPDGQEWLLLQPAFVLEMPDPVIVGLEVFSALNDQPATATFSDFQIRY